jgi:WXG100 family type VII secretion target
MSDRESGVTSGVAQTQAESAVMAQTATKFENVNGSLQSMLSNLLNELSVLQSAWAGRGAMAFEQVKSEWARNQEQLSRALAETATAIRTSGVSYDASDSEAASRVGRAGGQFNLPL